MGYIAEMTIIPHPLPPLEFLRECFWLDAETGHLFWQARPRAHFKRSNEWVTTNWRHGGLRADHPSGWFGYLGIRFRYEGEPLAFLGHRVVWKMSRGVEPPDIIDHIDRNPANNRPDNLREATAAENWRNSSRQIRKELAPRANMASLGKPAKSHCKHGHPLSGDNLYVWRSTDNKTGANICRACQAVAARRWRIAKYPNALKGGEPRNV